MTTTDSDDDTWEAPGAQIQEDDDRTLEAGEYLQSFWRACPAIRRADTFHMGQILTAECVPRVSGPIHRDIQEQLSDVLRTLELPRNRARALLKIVSRVHRTRTNRNSF